LSLKAPLAQATETARAQGGRFQVLLGVFAALAALAWMALFPGSAARCGRELHQGIVLPLLFAAGAAAALRIRGRQCALLSFALVAAALLLPLWWRWFSGESDTMLVGGLLPYSDASDYLANAQRLASGERFTGDANNRPIATAMLAVLWKLTGGDYRLVLALIALLGASAAWLAMAEISLLLGPAAAAAWLFVDILFLRRFAGIPMTEHLGVLLGSLAVAFGCRAARAGRRGNWIWAAFAMALALCARAGPMLVLLALLCGAFLAQPRRERRRWVLPGLMAVSMMAAFALSRIVSLCVGNPDYLTNAVYILHGLVFGGTWKDAMGQYGNDRHAVWLAVEAQVLAHPFSLLSGGARSLFGFVRQCYLFSFAGRRWLNAALHVAFAAGGVSALSMLRHDRRAWWLLAPLIGLLASMALLPPWDTDVMRIYAATIPLLAFTVAVGVHAGASAMRASRKLGSDLGTGRPGGDSHVPADAGRIQAGRMAKTLLAAAVLLCALLPPLLRLRASQPRSSLEDAYASGEEKSDFTYLPRAALWLVPNEAPRGLTRLRLADFGAGLADFASLYPAEGALLASLPSDCAVLPRDGRFSFVVIDAAHVPAGKGSPAANARFQFVTQGMMLLAVDESLLARSPALTAYHPGRVGLFSFSNERYPVIRAGDTVTYAEIITSLDFAPPSAGRQNVNPVRPIVLDVHRLNFPVPGEYCLRLNKRDMLRLLVLARDSATPEANRRIADFVTSNCIAETGNAVPSGGHAAQDVERLSCSESPASMSEASKRELTALLQSAFEGSGPP